MDECSVDGAGRKPGAVRAVLFLQPPVPRFNNNQLRTVCSFHICLITVDYKDPDAKRTSVSIRFSELIFRLGQLPISGRWLGLGLLAFLSTFPYSFSSLIVSR